MKKDFSFTRIAIQQIDARHDIVLTFDEQENYVDDPISRRVIHLLMLAFSMYHDEDLMTLLHRWGWEPNSDDIHRTGLQLQISWERNVSRNLWIWCIECRYSKIN